MSAETFVKVQDWLLKRNDLSGDEKILMGLIVSLHENDGCKCSNRYLAERLWVSVGAIKQHLVRLRRKGALEANKMKFGQKFKGNRLIPVTNCDRRVSNCNPEVTVRDTDKNTIRTEEERERMAAPGKFSEDWKAEIVSLLADRGVEPERAKRRLEQEIRELTCSASLETVSQWPAYMHKIIINEDAAKERKDRKKERERPVSQFSKVF